MPRVAFATLPSWLFLHLIFTFFAQFILESKERSIY